MAITKEQIVNDLLNQDFELDGVTDYRRITEFVKTNYSVRLSNKATWAIINQLKDEDLAVLDFD